MTERELESALLSIFDLGLQIGQHIGKNNPTLLDQVKKDKAGEFTQVNKLMQQIKDHFKEVS